MPALGRITCSSLPAAHRADEMDVSLGENVDMCVCMAEQRGRWGRRLVAIYRLDVVYSTWGVPSLVQNVAVSVCESRRRRRVSVGNNSGATPVFWIAGQTADC